MSSGNPSDCMPELVGWYNKPFCIARFRSCGPALARFTRVVDARSAKRLSFEKLVEKDGRFFRRRVSVAVQAGRRFVDVFPWLFKPDVVSSTCFRGCSSQTSFRRRVSVTVILFSRWSCGLSDKLSGDYCGCDFEVRLVPYVDISWSRRHPPPLLRCRSLPIRKPVFSFRPHVSGCEFSLGMHLY